MHTHRVKWGTQTMGGNVGFYECIHTRVKWGTQTMGGNVGFLFVFHLWLYQVALMNYVQVNFTDANFDTD